MSNLKIKTLIEQLPYCLEGSQQDLILWIKSFAEINDNYHLQYDSQNIARLFREAGYTSEPTDSRKITLQEHGLEAYGNRLVEFALYFFEGNKPLPKTAIRFAEYYMEHSKG